MKNQTRLNRSVSGLTKIASDFLIEEFDMVLEIPISINGRLKRAMGRYIHNTKNESVGMDFAKFLVDHGDDELVVSVIKHECIHYAMHRAGRPFADGHYEFEAELERHGALSTGTVRLEFPQPVHYFNCDCGKNKHSSPVKFRQARICRSCRGRLSFSKTVEEIR